MCNKIKVNHLSKLNNIKHEVNIEKNPRFFVGMDLTIDLYRPPIRIEHPSSENPYKDPVSMVENN